jgi:hypothetical protein
VQSQSGAFRSHILHHENVRGTESRSQVRMRTYRYIHKHAYKNVQTYCHLSGARVTNKAGFGFHDRIYLTNHCLHLDTLDFWPHFITPLFRYTPSPLLTVTSCKSSARTPWKTPCSVVKNECLLARYVAMNILLLLSEYGSGCVY